MDLTPSGLRDIVWRAAQELSGGQPDTPIKASDVAARVTSYLNLAPDDEERRRKVVQNTSWVGTQVLTKAGLLKPSARRGWWEIVGSTPEGGPSPEAPAPEPSTPSAVRSPWAEDAAGVSAFAPVVAPPYSEDPYILGLAIVSTRCFGKYLGGHVTCATCPLVSPCRAQVFNTLHHIAEVLQLRSAQSSAEGPSEGRRPPPNPAASESLGDILDELDAPKKGGPAQVPRKRPNGSFRGKVQVPSVCDVCGGSLPEGSDAIFDPLVGCRHITCGS